MDAVEGVEGAGSPRGDVLVRRLASAVPCAGVWDWIEFGSLSAAGRVDAVVAVERLLRHVQALSVRALGELAAHPDPGVRAGSNWQVEQAENLADLQAALALSPVAARVRLYDADILTSRHPEVVELLAAGEIQMQQASAVVAVTDVLDEDAARAAVAGVLDRMAERTVSSTRQLLRRAAMKADPQAVEKRRERQVRERCVEVRAQEDGMASLELYTTAEQAAAMKAVIDAIAKPRAQGDDRSLDQRRADTLAAMVLGAQGVTATPGTGAGTGPGARDAFNASTRPGSFAPVPAAPTAQVHVLVDLAVLLGLSDAPGHLEGHGPLTARAIRDLAFASGSVWRRLITDPDTGAIVKEDPHTYKPTADTARHVRARHRRCTFPNCSMPARRCDLDHADAFNHSDPSRGGKTTRVNLHPLCRTHHLLKTAGIWTPRLSCDGRTVHWTNTRTGHQYTTPATNYHDLA
jgi:hypothetical protein